MRAKQRAGVLAALFVAATMGGCTTNEDAQAVESTPTQPATQSQEIPADAPGADEPMDDAAICTAYGDVMTIVENADLGLDDGRMEAQEHEGWYRLATRVLDRLPSGEGSAVRQAIAELQEVAPAISLGAGEGPSGVQSTEWHEAQGALGDACDDLGVPLSTSVFTGG
ncbi:hypothetical protein LQF12_07225 [Ruania suaedae]|uniref:hypothetical protein n=1 Tax=Ruania suaedae TaxID=2897774 RepID=UPI001E59F8D6|nr:hypothetical protein [Ruania suaedae]UFU04361.1 hypothetical protein LQF12_07225 [Ruania suaedae]